MSKLVAVKLLIFSVSPSKYFVIYSEKNAPFLDKFSSRVWSAPGPLFCLSLIAKSCVGDKVALKLAFNFICSCFYFYTLQAAISRSRISFWFSFMIFLFIRRMPADINTCPTNTPREFHVESMWCVFRVTHSKGPPVIGLFGNSMQYFIWLNIESLLYTGCYYFFCHSEYSRSSWKTEI